MLTTVRETGNAFIASAMMVGLHATRQRCKMYWQYRVAAAARTVRSSSDPWRRSNTGYCDRNKCRRNDQNNYSSSSNRRQRQLLDRRGRCQYIVTVRAHLLHPAQFANSSDLYPTYKLIVVLLRVQSIPVWPVNILTVMTCFHHYSTVSIDTDLCIQPKALWSKSLMMLYMHILAVTYLLTYLLTNCLCISVF